MTDDNYEFDEISEPGFLARIVGFEDQRSTMYFRQRNGTVQAVSSTDEELLGSVDDVIFVTNNSYRIVSSDMWVEDTMVGVVRLKDDEVTVLDIGNRVVTVPATTAVHFEVHNTVEATESRGVIRVLSHDALPPLDRAAASDELLARVKQTDFSDADALDSIGGLTEVVREARRLVLLPMEEPQRFEKLGGSPIKGVLFTGPPGVGKTMLARALAREAGAAFYNIRGPELSSMWVGESERILRKIFEDAGREERSLIFFDEFDSIGGQRSERAHEASRHLVAQLLTLMDGFTQYDNVVVLAATNRIQDVDKALRRPGRFDWELQFPHPQHRDRVDILKKSARGISVAGDLPYEDIASRTEGWTGADLAAIWREVVLLAAVEARAVVTAEDLYVGHERAAVHRARRKQQGMD
jgi:transitional endoplasmic reticulum ATPase